MTTLSAINTEHRAEAHMLRAEYPDAAKRWAEAALIWTSKADKADAAGETLIASRLRSEAINAAQRADIARSWAICNQEA